MQNAVGDKDDNYGGLGSNGAQKMGVGEWLDEEMLAAEGTYSFKPGIIHNLKADKFVANHGDVANRNVAAAVAQVVV
jgi:hypothetical protein